MIKVTLFFITTIFASGILFAAGNAKNAVDIYKKGLIAMKAGQCTKAQQLFSKARKIIPRDNRRLPLYGRRTYKYLPNAMLKTLKGQCREVIVAKPVIKKPAIPLAISLAHKNSIKTKAAKVKIFGTVSGSGKLKLQINELTVPINQGKFLSIIPNNGQKQTITLRLSNAKKTLVKTVTLIPLYDALTISITKPRKGETTSARKVIIEGRINGGNSGNKITLNQQPISVNNGRFSLPKALVLGKNIFTIEARNNNNKVVAIRSIIRYKKLRVSLDKVAVARRGKSVELRGKIIDGYGHLLVKIDARKVSLKRGRFKHTLITSKNSVSIVVQAGTEKVRKKIKITADLHPLKIKFNELNDGHQTLQSKMTIKGRVSGGEGKVNLRFNGKNTALKQDGQFQLSLSLQFGKNKINLQVSDQYQRTASNSLSIEKVRSLAIVIGQGDYVWSKAKIIKITGRVEGGMGQPKLWVAGKQVSLNRNRLFQTILPVKSGETKVLLKAKDTTGKTIHKTIRIVGE